MNSDTDRRRAEKQGCSSMQMMAALFSLLLVIISLLLVSVNLHAATPGFAVPKGDTSKATATGTTAVTATATATHAPTPTATATNTPTATATATATHTPTPTATATRTPTATATATHVPTATATTAQSTPTVALGTTPTGVVSTATATKKPTAATIATAVGTQTPTAISGNPTSNGNGNGGNSNTNGTPPPGTQAGWLSLPAVIIGLLVVLGFVSAALIGLVILRNRLLSPTVPERMLPPSGAQPWKRVRTGSLNGLPNNQNEAMAAVTLPGGVLQHAPILNATSMNTNANGFPPQPPPQWGNTNGFPPPQQSPQWGNTNGYPPPQPPPHWGNANGFPPPQQQPHWGNANGYPSQQPQWGNTNGFPPQQSWGNTATNTSNTGFSPAPQWSNSATSDFPPLQTGTFPSRANPSSLSGEQVALQQPSSVTTAIEQKKMSRPLPASVRLQAMQTDSGRLPAIPVTPQSQERVSEAMPSLDDPLLQDALEQYKLRGKLAQQEGNEGNG